jgi:hypothetical protein
MPRTGADVAKATGAAESEATVLKVDCLARGKSSGQSEAAPTPITAEDDRKQRKSSLNADAKEFKPNQKASAGKSGAPKSTTTILAQQLLEDGDSGATVASEALAVVSERSLRPGT